MSIERSFLGTGWCFPPQFMAAERSVEMVSAEEDIEQSIHIILSTSPGERVMDPLFGCGIKKMVFEEINQATIAKLMHLISRSLLYFEPRINVELIEIGTDNAMEGRLDIDLNFTVITTNARRNMVYPFYILEGTLVDL
ncbi:GPW/gp25 family protein [Shewanella psychropiezotolerans]|uniref:GPW/gp25 family protein n=2 Tax=Shewanellaceae TaxID=267890 RepID=A0ABX5X695_9GAMM|nr:GPW/gp25 family protein [Shewanella sp. YLB-07]QDO86806.1 GPW/gp25 family protein [Shewanella psychropiezotolerans]